MAPCKPSPPAQVSRLAISIASNGFQGKPVCPFAPPQPPSHVPYNRRFAEGGQRCQRMTQRIKRMLLSGASSKLGLLFCHSERSEESTCPSDITARQADS